MNISCNFYSVVLQVLVNYARSSKEAEEVSKEVCSLFFFVYISILIVPGLLSRKLYLL